MFKHGSTPLPSTITYNKIVVSLYIFNTYKQAILHPASYFSSQGKVTSNRMTLHRVRRAECTVSTVQAKTTKQLRIIRLDVY